MSYYDGFSYRPFQNGQKDEEILKPIKFINRAM